jgi:hypothetical protein
MVTASFPLQENYWEEFELQENDIEFLYAHLLEVETPLTPQELIEVLVRERIRREVQAIEEQRLAGGEIYLPKNQYEPDQILVFPAFGWKRGQVVGTRLGINPDFGEFKVIKVELEDGEEREFASQLDDHPLNHPPDIIEDEVPDTKSILEEHKDELITSLERDLRANKDFVYIAGRWFPRALLVDVHTGHLNLAEAVLDVENGGPLPTSTLLEQVELPSNENPKLVEFSLDLALQEDKRFDEVGPAGEVLWFLQRLEPEEVRETPIPLRYQPIEYDRSLLTQEMLALVRELDDELSPLEGSFPQQNEVVLPLLYPHWRSGTLPLSPRVRPLFPTAYEAPRIRFVLVDGHSGENFPGWVVRNAGYVYGLRDWYQERGLIPGSLVRVQRGMKAGEVIVQADTQRSSRDWVRTVLVGSDGGLVFAMLKQVVTAAYDERMAIAIPDVDQLDQMWEQQQEQSRSFERIVVNMVRELTKLNPQSHVHASELYATVNLIRRCPPGPILALLASRPWFVHVGDLHFRFDDSEQMS